MQRIIRRRQRRSSGVSSLVKCRMKISQDAYGKQLLAQYNTQTPTAELIERDDNYIEYGSNLGLYFSVYEDWSDTEHEAIKRAKDRILDVGCGAGRHALYLQEKGFNITGIDNSPGAIKVCKLRGLKKAFVRPIDEVDKFKPASFDTIMMMGNNFGLFGSRKNAKTFLKSLRWLPRPKQKSSPERSILIKPNTNITWIISNQTKGAAEWLGKSECVSASKKSSANGLIIFLFRRKKCRIF